MKALLRFSMFALVLAGCVEQPLPRPAAQVSDADGGVGVATEALSGCPRGLIWCNNACRHVSRCHWDQ